MTCEHIMFSDDNLVELSALVTNVEPVTDLDNLKNEHRSRQVKWNSFANPEIIIEGHMDNARLVRLLSIPGHNLLPTAEVRLQLFLTDSFTTQVYDSGNTLIGNILPLGIWAAGIDPYGAADNESLDDVISLILDEPILATGWRVTITHKYGYVEPTEPPPVIVSDDIYRQDPATGVLSIEAENGTVESEPGVDTWGNSSRAGSSGGSSMYIDTTDYHHTGSDGPRISFEFTATVSGEHRVWLRMFSEDVGGVLGGYSLFTTFNGSSTRLYFNSIVNQGWEWRPMKTITLSAGQKYSIYISHRHRPLTVDKMVIKPSAEPGPVGTGPAESGFGTKTIDGGTGAITTTDSLNLRMLVLSDVIQPEKNFSFGSEIKFLTEPDLHFTHSGFAITSRPQRAAKMVSLSLDSMTEGDRFKIRNYETKLAGKPFIVSPYPSGTAQWFRDDYLFLARLANTLEYTHLANKIHRTRLHLVEV